MDAYVIFSIFCYDNFYQTAEFLKVYCEPLYIYHLLPLTFYEAHFILRSIYLPIKSTPLSVPSGPEQGVHTKNFLSLGRVELLS